MLKRFSVSNFKGFGKRLSLVLDNPANYGFNTEIIRNGIKTKGLVYGINGSGKSNLGLALFDIIFHLTDKERIQQRYHPYLNLKSKKHCAEFEYVFEFDGCEVVYQYAKTSAVNLTYEKLTIGNDEVLYYDFAQKQGYVELAGAESLQIGSSLPDATDVLSRVKFVRNNAILQDNATNRVFTSLMSFVDRMLMFFSLDQNGHQGLSVGSESVTQGIIKAGRLEDFERFLLDQGLDYDLCAVDINGQQELYCQYEGTSVPFMSVASTGTRSLALFYYWYIRISDASFVFIDEFDAFYHFELAEQIVVMLRSLVNSQIFLTTHNTDLMSNDLLRPDAYFYLRNGTLDSLDNLSDKELRKAHNLQKMFKAGSFDE